MKRRLSQQDLEWREHQPADEDAIRNMFKDIFSREMSPDYWKWRFERGPFGPATIRLAWHEGDLVGHYAVFPVTVLVDNLEVPAGMSMTTMVDPRYVSVGTFQMLGEEAYADCLARGITVIYGFPNRNAFPGRIKRLGWRDMGRIYQRSIAVEKLAAECHLELMDTGGFGSEVEMLLERVAPTARIQLARTREYLEWRFSEEPNNEYPILGLRKSGRLDGLAVLKIYGANGSRTGHVVEMLTAGPEGAEEELLRGVAAFSASHECSRMTLWSLGYPELDAAATRLGFADDPSTETIFGCRALTEAAEIIYEPGVWHLAMSDSDVF